MQAFDDAGGVGRGSAGGGAAEGADQRCQQQRAKVHGGPPCLVAPLSAAWRCRRAGVPRGAAAAALRSATARRVLLIEDSKHFQNLVTLLLQQACPDVELHVADDGISGLAMVGQLQPEVLIVDLLLPGIDGAALVTSLRSRPQFSRMRLIVVTALDDSQRAPYAFALQGVPLVHKLQLAERLPQLLGEALAPT
ncbi:MAG: response regulator [Rubrivivax sp.]